MSEGIDPAELRLLVYKEVVSGMISAGERMNQDPNITYELLKLLPTVFDFEVIKEKDNE